MIGNLAFIVGLVGMAILDHLAARREQQRAAPAAPDVYVTRDEAVAQAVSASSDGDFVVIHHKPCTDACSCERPEVHRIARGQA